MIQQENTFVEQQEDEQEQIDTTDYGEYTQQPVQLRRSRPAQAAPQPDKHQPDDQQAKRQRTLTTHAIPRTRRSLRQHFAYWIRKNLLYIGIAMLLTLLFIWLMTSFVVPLVTSVYVHWTYGGDVPITQCDANVGHNGTSHFLAEYWRGEVIVIEFPGQDPTKARTYVFPLTTHDTTHRILTLHIERVNLHGQPGKPDIAIEVEGYNIAPVLYNTGDAFTTSQP